MNEDDNVNEQLTALENVIGEKIQIIRDLLHQEQKAVVQEIVMKKNHSTDPTYPKYDKKTCYYQQFWKVYLLNEIIMSKIKDYSITNKQVSIQLTQLQENQKQWTSLMIQKSKKKQRRTSDMIQKSFACPFPQCQKPYGSYVSLNLHLKLKHNSGTKTQREALAKQICLAEEKGLQVDINLTFPPGYLQEFRESFRIQSRK